MKLGPYELDTIHCGECSEMMRALPDECIDLTVTSPPYGTLREYQGYTFDFPSVAAQLWRVTKKGGVVVWVVGDQTIDGSETGTSFRQALGFMELGFNLHDTIIWDKLSPNHPDNRRYGQVWEYMFVLCKEVLRSFNPIIDRKNKYSGTKIHGTKRETNGRTTQNTSSAIISDYGKRFNIWYIANKPPAGNKHPAIFPEALARDHIISWSNSGDLVLDPMMGSGTTAKMSKQLGRHWLGFDISAEYVKLAQKRVQQTQPPLPELVSNLPGLVSPEQPELL